jgi:hypothetical protein
VHSWQAAQHQRQAGPFYGSAMGMRRNQVVVALVVLVIAAYFVVRAMLH